MEILQLLDSDDKWAGPTCGEFGGPGGFKADYTLNAEDSSIDGDGFLTVECQDGSTSEKTFGDTIRLFSKTMAASNGLSSTTSGRLVPTNTD